MNTFLKVTSRLYRGCYKAFWRIQNALTKNEVDEKHFQIMTMFEAHLKY